MKLLLISAMALTITTPVLAKDCFFFCGSQFNGDRQPSKTSSWNGKFGKEGFAWHTPNYNQSVARGPDLASKHAIDTTHAAKRVGQTDGKMADNGLGGKGKDRAGPSGGNSGATSDR